MGYVSDNQMSQFISPFQMGYSAGTWTPTLTSNVIANVRTANNSAFNLFIPILLPQHEVNLTGCRLKSIDVYWKNATADLDAVGTVELEKMTLTADTAAVTAAAVTTSIDTGNDSSAKRLTQASHTMTVTVTTPEWVRNTAAYGLTIAFDAAAGSVVSIIGARANYEFRV